MGGTLKLKGRRPHGRVAPYRPYTPLTECSSERERQTQISVQSTLPIDIVGSGY
jgi:hypothetical protein